MNILLFRKSSLWLIVLLCLTVCSCSSRSGKHTATMNKTVYQPEYAKGFVILGSDSVKSTMIRVTDPWQGSKGVVMDYFIARDGEQPPVGFKGQVIKAGAKKIVCMSSSYVAMYDALGQVDRISGVSGLNYITNEYIRANSDKIKDVGADINYEVVAMMKPDVILIYGIGDEKSATTDKLRELSIPYMYVGEYLEESPLGKAEWVVALSELTDSRDKGIEVFEQIPERYDSLKNLVAGVGYRPKVMLNTPWGDSWVMPPVKSYMPQLIEDAGGDYIYKENTTNSSKPIGLETAYMLVSQADYWLNVNSFNSSDDVLKMNADFAKTKVFKEKKIYNNNLRTTASGANDFWESSVVKPDIVLRDLIKILHPELVSDSLYYYKQLQ